MFTISLHMRGFDLTGLRSMGLEESSKIFVGSLQSPYVDVSEGFARTHFDYEERHRTVVIPYSALAKGELTKNDLGY